MSILANARRPVNLALAPPRNRLSGRFAPACDPCAIGPVALPGGLVGWRVGPAGLIFAERAHAERYAVVRARKIAAAERSVAVAESPRAPSPALASKPARRSIFGLGIFSGDDDFGIDARLDEMAVESAGADAIDRGSRSF